MLFITFLVKIVNKIFLPKNYTANVQKLYNVLKINIIRLKHTFFKIYVLEIPLKTFKNKINFQSH